MDVLAQILDAFKMQPQWDEGRRLNPAAAQLFTEYLQASERIKHEANALLARRKAMIAQYEAAITSAQPELLGHWTTYLDDNGVPMYALAKPQEHARQAPAWVDEVKAGMTE